MSQNQFVNVVMKHDGEHIHHGKFKSGDTVKVTLEEAGQLCRQNGNKQLAVFADAKPAKGKAE